MLSLPLGTPMTIVMSGTCTNRQLVVRL